MSEDGTGGKGTETTERIRGAAQDLVGALKNRAFAEASSRATSLTERLGNIAEGSGTGGKVAGKAAEKVAHGDNPVKAAVTSGASGLKDAAKNTLSKATKSGGGGKKITSIIEEIDVPVPRSVAYAKWTQFEDFPSFMKKVEDTSQQEETKLRWRAQVLWSHRSWESTILEQEPDDHIVWESSGDKGYVDGVVTFHELAPNLTRILLVLEYHPKGLFEHVGNIWRAQGRRARLELKHFRRELSRQAFVQPDEIQGWRGTIHDKEVTDSGEDGQGDDSKKDEQQSESGGNGRREGRGKSRRNEGRGRGESGESGGRRSENGSGSAHRRRPAKKASQSS